MEYKSLKEINAADFNLEKTKLNMPFVVRGLVEDWPLVKKSNEPISEISKYLLYYYESNRVIAFANKHEDGNKFTYADSHNRKSFEQLESTLDLILETIGKSNELGNPGTIYMGSTSLDYVLPGFEKENTFITEGIEPLKSIWIGNKTIVPPHFDVPDNIAFVCTGSRKFTLFPPEQIKNLYMGPIEFTPAGQPISMVDIEDPDFEKYPNFKDAMDEGLTATLYPGDAIFIPSLWWHQVESFGDLNILINYWWRSTPSFMGNPMDGLLHSLMSIRDLPDHQKEYWRNLFNFLIFDYKEENFSHIPDDIAGSLGAIDDKQARAIRSMLIANLNR